MRTICFAVSLLAAGITATPQRCLAQEQHEESAAHEAGEAEHHKNHASIFIGATTENVDATRSSSFSLGLDYERRVSQWIGLAIGGELVFEGEEREALAGLFVNIHATRGLVLSAGPGVEFSKEHHDEGDVEAESAEAPSESSTHAALRAGGLYEFELGRRATIAPAVYVDLISGKRPAYVWGLSVGVGF